MLSSPGFGIRDHKIPTLSWTTERVGYKGRKSDFGMTVGFFLSRRRTSSFTTAAMFSTAAKAAVLGADGLSGGRVAAAEVLADLTQVGGNLRAQFGGAAEFFFVAQSFAEAHLEPPLG